jgi:phytoene dehydrogenase-like protein
MDRSPNPLKNIFQIIEEDCDWITYDRWGTVLPSGEKFAAKIGPEEFGDVLREHGGPGAEADFAAIMERMAPLSNAAQALTSMALREDAGAILTLLKYPKELFATLRQGQALNEPFSTIVDELQRQNKFVKNWLDMLCFLLQGLPAGGTMNAVIAYMLADWYRPGVTLDYPRGGSGAIVDALVRGVKKHGRGNNVCMNCHVDEILVENDKAVGVKLASGQVIRAKQAVVSNADPYITNKLLSKAREEGNLHEKAASYMDSLIDTNEDTGGVPDLKSFIHIHAGIDASGLPETPSADFPAQWAVVRNWDGPEGVEDPRNIVLCSMPSLIDPSLAPEGKHVIHAYVPATEPYEWWEGMDRNSEEYKQKKEEAADFLWSAIEEYVPDARNRAVPGTVQIGTPLTHERFLRRTRGAYG